jgi:hypothetical protein
MIRHWRTAAFLVMALFLTLAASYAELQVIGAGITIGDMEGSPPAQTETGKAFMRAMSHRGDEALWLAIVALVPACILLGTVLARRLEAHLPYAGRTLGYFVGFLLCPAASFAGVLLTLFLGSALHR